MGSHPPSSERRGEEAHLKKTGGAEEDEGEEAALAGHREQGRRGSLSFHRHDHHHQQQQQEQHRPLGSSQSGAQSSSSGLPREGVIAPASVSAQDDNMTMETDTENQKSSYRRGDQPQQFQAHRGEFPESGDHSQDVLEPPAQASSPPQRKGASTTDSPSKTAAPFELLGLPPAPWRRGPFNPPEQLEAEESLDLSTHVAMSPNSVRGGSLDLSTHAPMSPESVRGSLDLSTRASLSPNSVRGSLDLSTHTAMSPDGVRGSLDLSTHAATSPKNAAATKEKSSSLSPEGQHQQQRASAAPYSEGQEGFSSPTRTQGPGGKPLWDIPGSKGRDFFYPGRHLRPGNERPRGGLSTTTTTTTINEEQDSFSPSKVPVPASSFSRNGDLHASFSSASRMFASPYSSSSSSSSPPSSSSPSSPYAGQERPSTSWLKQEHSPHPQESTEEPSAGPSLERRASASLPNEERTPASATSSAPFLPPPPHLPQFPMRPPLPPPAVDQLCAPGGWPAAFPGMMLPGAGGMGAPGLQGLAMMPPMGPPTPATVAATVVAAAAAAAATAATAAVAAADGNNGDTAQEGSGQGQVYCCHLCDFTASNKDDFEGHMSVHYKFSCTECDYKSRTEGRLLKHMRDFHSDPEHHQTTPSRPKVFRCKHCGFTCTDRMDSWRHRALHIKEEKRLECPHDLCPFVTEYKHHMEYHVKNHLEIKTHKCHKCNYSCVNKSMLNSHMKSHTKACQFRCLDCPFAAKYSHSMKLHLQKNGHRQGPVLNSDGSLPQYGPGVGGGGGGGGRKGPQPPGPAHGPAEAGFTGAGSSSFLPRFFPMVPPSPAGGGLPPHAVPGLSPIMPNGMFPFSPWWPVMANPHPPHAQRPPPLIDMRALGHGLPSAPADPMEGFRAAHPSFRSEQSDGGARSGSWDKKDYTCEMCPFTCEAPDQLHSHMLKVHASESADRRNAVPPSDASDSQMLSQSQAQCASASASATSQSTQEVANGENTESSPPPSSYPQYGSEADVRSTLTTESAPKQQLSYEQHRFFDHLYRHNNGRYRVSQYLERQRSHERDAYTEQQTPQLSQQLGSAEGPGEEINILQQMTQRFGCGTSTSPPPFVSQLAASKADRPVSQEPERAERESLGPGHKSVSPTFQESGQSTLQNTGEEKQSTGIKRNNEETGLGEESTREPFFQPRKRSRKGKAFKLDELYLKRQEQQQQLKSMERQESLALKRKETDKSEENEKAPSDDTEKMPENQSEQYSSRPVDEVFKQLQKDIQLLNDGPSQDDPKDPHEENADHRVVQAEEQSDETQDTEQKEKAACPAQSLSGHAEEREDPEKERESLIQRVCMNRHRPLPPSLRRGSEVAWKMMTDPSLGLKLPPEALAQVSREKTSSDLSPVPSSRHKSFSEGQSPASARTPDKSRRMSLPWSTSSPYTQTSSRSDSDGRNVFPSSQAVAALAVPRTENGRIAASLQNPSAWMELNMPVPPFQYRPQPSPRERFPFSHYSHRSSTSSQTVGAPPLQMPDFMPGQHAAFGPQPPRPQYPLAFPELPSYECPHCEMSFKDGTQHGIHMWFHTTDNPFECRGCGSVSDNKVDFYRHLVMVKHS